MGHGRQPRHLFLEGELPEGECSPRASSPPRTLRRLGWKPLELFAAAVRTVEVVWIDEALHRQAEEILFGHRKHGITIVDASGFAVMTSRGVDTAFAFDDDFRREEFTVLRSPRRT